MAYEFQEEDAYRFSRERAIPAGRKGNELVFKYCPYCGALSKDRNKFAINLMTGQFHCFRASCGVQGNMITLAKDFGFRLSGFDEQEPKRSYRKFPNMKIQSKDAAVRYMAGRGISEAVTKRYQITVQTDHPNILVFPFYDHQEELQFIKYRKTDFDKTRDSCKEWCETDGMPILFGMNHCEGYGRLVITEGQIDSLSLSEAGIPNAVSVPTGANGFTWVPNCYEWLNRFEELVVFGDCENGKITLLEELRKRFARRVRAVRMEDYQGCKDANELLVKCGRESVQKAVEQAELVPLKCIRSLADVENVDIYSLPKLMTHIPAVDRVLGGIYYGQLILLTGRRGEGKSTFMSQLIAEALAQNVKTLIYSGELMDYHFKRWLDMQLAGPHGLIVNQNRFGETYYDIPKSRLEEISGWYRDKAFLYDNNSIEDEELEDLLGIVEKAIQQYGIRLVCIDNLMTALDVALSDDLYRAQSKFVKKLAVLAKRYGIIIILVAHPRKNNTELTNDDISGSADITNRVDVVMGYTTDKDFEDGERRFTVTKNRLTGKLTGKEKIKLFYDPVSKRISDTEGNFEKEYQVGTGSDGFEPVGEDGQEELPFQ